MKTILKKIVQRILLALRDALDPFFLFQELSVLCYHSISDHPHETAVRAEQFKKQLGVLSARGYRFVSLDDVAGWLASDRALPRKCVALTFDDGYADFETAALPVAKKFNAPVALFITEGNVGRSGFLSRDALERLRRDPLVEIGFHTHTHPNLEKLSGEWLEREVRPMAGERFFAYPGGQYSPEATAAVKAAGYRAAFSIKPTLVAKSSDRFILPRNVILAGMRPWQVRFRATQAAAWYRAAWRILP